ncbi:glycosyltransferase family 52 [Aeromonas salmonicida]|uniref:glycosyltransferase family 52 n=1 Tax=Aeromonas salmonicida TaxID=645 RepID=UPI00259FB9F4|nr:glycosyltransferase family 52 [Aeromonas salmonicida]MDM5128114.1 glycosyltransferase family 52 protein [Aeromonas salmonicida]
MNLFVCYTHLQLVIASRIIAHRNLLPDDVELFYISKIDNDVTKNTLQDMREICGEVTFIHMKLKYPLYFPAIFKHFFQRQYDAVFIASIDNILIHFILSRIHFNNLYTFDDGSANIILGSIYYQDISPTIISSLYRQLLSVKFNMTLIKQISQMHYTIYDGYTNIIKQTTLIGFSSHVDEGPDAESVSGKNSACNVFVGAVYSSLFSSDEAINYYLNKCWSIIKHTDRDTFFLPHPREVKYSPPNDIEVIKAKYIAEREISNLLHRYEYVYLYGFLSSCQIHMASDERVINNVFYSSELSSTFKKAISGSMVSRGMNIVDIDKLL